MYKSHNIPIFIEKNGRKVVALYLICRCVACILWSICLAFRRCASIEIGLFFVGLYGYKFINKKFNKFGMCENWYNIALRKTGK